jgi:hypothetical protein
MQSKTLTWEDLATIGADLQTHKDKYTKACFSAFKEADYERGDIIFVNTIFFKQAKLPEIVSHRIKSSEYVVYGTYFVHRTDREENILLRGTNYHTIILDGLDKK